MIPLEVVLDRPGRTPLRLTPVQTSLNFTTNAVGGFASCSFTLPGDPAKWKREIPQLSTLRVVLDTFVIWEGEVQDVTLRLLGGELGAGVTCIGLGAALLGRTSVRRIWSLRNVPWIGYPGGSGTAIGTSGLTLTNLLDSSTGSIDVTDLTKLGIRVAGNGSAVAINNIAGQLYVTTGGLAITTVLGTLTLTGANTGVGKLAGVVLDSVDGTTWAGPGFLTASQSVNRSLSASASRLFLGGGTAGAITPTATDTIDWTSIRVLGTSLAEDASGGFYGGTILTDLIGLVPGLTVGVIESGSDFTLQSIERTVRSFAIDVVNEVIGYYTREWRVWEDGRFDWKSVNKDEPQWLATISDLDDGTELTSTVDGLAKNVYVLFPDVLSGLDNETNSGFSTNQRNPYAKQGKTSDAIVSPGFSMTSVSASQLATRLIGDSGAYPQIQGRIVIPATRTIRRVTGPPLPAFMIRGGDNILVADFPKTELFAQGRDGETLFHVISTQADFEQGRMVLEVEGQISRASVLLARLAAVTRSLTS